MRAWWGSVCVMGAEYGDAKVVGTVDIEGSVGTIVTYDEQMDGGMMSHGNEQK